MGFEPTTLRDLVGCSTTELLETLVSTGQMWVLTKGRSLSREHATDVEKWDILDETLNAPQEEKLAISAEELTILAHSVKRKQSNLPNLDGKRSQKERKRSQSGMWEVREMKMNMHLL